MFGRFPPPALEVDFPAAFRLVFFGRVAFFFAAAMNPSLVVRAWRSNDWSDRVDQILVRLSGQLALGLMPMPRGVRSSRPRFGTSSRKTNERDNPQFYRRISWRRPPSGPS
jgi:hypothetical protein